MKTISLKNKYILAASALLFVLAVVFATFYDLEINTFLYNKNSTFGFIFRVFGEIPAFILLPLCFNIFGVKLIRKKTFWSIILLVIVTALAIVFWHTILHKFVIAEFLPNFPNLVAIAISVVFGFGGLYLLSLINQNTLNTLFMFALLIIATVVATALFTHAIKLVFGRVRFRDLNSDLSDFTAWYSINGFTGHKSFVSGHTSAAGTIFALNFLPHYFAKLQKYKPLFVAISLLYVAAVGLSRIVVGAHYLSDVLFGALLAYLVTYSVQKIIIKKTNNNR